MLTQEIKNQVQNLWDRLWSGGLSNPITAIEQISYLLFMKRLENFHEATPDVHKWSIYHELEGRELVDRVKKTFHYIKNDLSQEDEPFAKAMTDAVLKIDKPALLKSAMGYIDSIYAEIDQEIERNQHFHDIQGDVYEHLLLHTAEAGKNGQFRTKRHIIHMMAALLDPKIDGRICDLASGTGGFLVGAYQYLVTKYSEHKTEDDDGLERGIDGNLLNETQKRQLKEDTFYGFDIDDTMVSLGVMNLMMHGISKPHIVKLDSLSAEYEAWEAQQLGEDFDSKDKDTLKNPTLQGQYKYIMANPPFTGKIDSPGVSENLDRVYPPKYEDPEKTKRKKQTVQSELLFLERMVYMLEVGGKAAVIVPEGVLFNSGKAHKEVRRILMTDCDLTGIISMPSGVFQPYTGVKTSILLFTKRQWKNNADQGQNVNVWFYGMESDGYTLDSNRRRLKNSFPLKEVIERWEKKDQEDQSDRKLAHFSIPFAEIEANGFELNFNLYKDFVYEAREYESSTVILSRIKELESEITKGLNQLTS